MSGGGLRFFDDFPVVAIECQGLFFESFETRASSGANDFGSESLRKVTEKDMFEDIVTPIQLSRIGKEFCDVAVTLVILAHIEVVEAGSGCGGRILDSVHLRDLLFEEFPSREETGTRLNRGLGADPYEGSIGEVSDCILNLPFVGGEVPRIGIEVEFAGEEKRLELLIAGSVELLRIGEFELGFGATLSQSFNGCEERRVLLMLLIRVIGIEKSEESSDVDGRLRRRHGRRIDLSSRIGRRVGRRSRVGRHSVGRWILSRRMGSWKLDGMLSRRLVEWSKDNRRIREIGNTLAHGTGNRGHTTTGGRLKNTVRNGH